MSELRYTLVGEGTSDRRLLPVLTWLLQQHSGRDIAGTWADLRVADLPRAGLAARIAAAVALYPCDLLFVHRDADAQGREARVTEIETAWSSVSVEARVPVVPIRMQETWFIVLEQPIRVAAGCPTGRMPLGLPPRATVERHADPKQTLRQALREASGLSGRHLARFDASRAAHRVAEVIDDYAYLRGLSGFDALEEDLLRALAATGLDR